jgi:hypothetical protein
MVRVVGDNIVWVVSLETEVVVMVVDSPVEVEVEVNNRHMACTLHQYRLS